MRCNRELNIFGARTGHFAVYCSNRMMCVGRVAVGLQGQPLILSDGVEAMYILSSLARLVLSCVFATASIGKLISGFATSSFDNRWLWLTNVARGASRFLLPLIELAIAIPLPPHRFVVAT